MGVVAGRGADYKSREDICLPMGASFQARYRPVGRQQLQCPDPGMIIAVLENQRRDDRAQGPDLAARKAVVVTALEPLIRVIGL